MGYLTQNKAPEYLISLGQEISSTRESHLTDFDLRLLAGTVEFVKDYYLKLFKAKKDTKIKTDFGFLIYTADSKVLEILKNPESPNALGIKLGFSDVDFNMGRGDAYFSIIVDDKDGSLAFGYPTRKGLDIIMSSTTPKE